MSLHLLPLSVSTTYERDLILKHRGEIEESLTQALQVPVQLVIAVRPSSPLPSIQDVERHPEIGKVLRAFSGKLEGFVMPPEGGDPP